MSFLKDFEKPFHVFANCFVVKGVTRSVLIDSQRNFYEYIPNSLGHVLTENQGDSIGKLIEVYGNQEIIEEYFEWLIEKEIVFFSENEEGSFPSISVEDYQPAAITNAILDVSSQHVDVFRKSCHQLESLGCVALLVRCLETETIEFVKQLLAEFNLTSFQSIELLLTYRDDYSIESIEELLTFQSRVFWHHCLFFSQRRS